MQWARIAPLPVEGDDPLLDVWCSTDSIVQSHRKRTAGISFFLQRRKNTLK